MNSTKVEIASELFKNGLNCAQSVLGAFCEDYGLEKETAFRLAGGLGSGARSAELCGAVSGAVLVIGLKHGEAKAVCNKKTKEFIKRFREENGDIVCRKLLGYDVTTPVGKETATTNNVFKTRCLDLVASAANILEELEY